MDAYLTIKTVDEHTGTFQIVKHAV